MMKYLERLGKSLMLPVVCLPVASILMGIGYWLYPTGWGANNVTAAFLIKAGSALIDNMAILFAIGVAVGMSDDNEGTAGLAGLVSWLIITTLLSTEAVAMFKGIDISEVPAAFEKIETQFVGIIAGIIGATCYNKFKSTKLPDALGFFSGKRSVAIVTAGASIVAALTLFFIWPFVYNGLVSFGKAIVSTNAVGAGIYTFFNRLLIPTGLHHALNSVFWFDVAGIDDIAKFWSGTGVQGVTGMYMTGFFPVMMFGLLAGAGFVDCFLSFKVPMAENPLYIIHIGLVFGVLYYVIFRFVIVKFNLKTPGREDEDDLTENTVVGGDISDLAKEYINALGGPQNILTVDNCITRLRLNVKDNNVIEDKNLTRLGARGVMRPGKGSIQVVVGTNVQFVADAIRAELKK